MEQSGRITHDKFLPARSGALVRPPLYRLGFAQLVDTVDAHGNPLPRGTVVLKLQTLRDSDGYWLDTGIFSLPR
jgi:hypothetical protein